MSAKHFIITTTAFLLGATAGAACGYLFSKNKFQEMADKEIESVKNVYSKHFEKNNETKDSGDIPVSNKDGKTVTIKQYNSGEVDSEKAHEKSYVDYTNQYKGNTNTELPAEILKAKKETKKVTKKEPYVISSTQFGEFDGFKLVTLFYFADKVLTDDSYNPIKNYIEVIGKNALNSFGDEDAVYVRDENLGIDYEILLDARKSTDIDDTMPGSNDIV